MYTKISKERVNMEHLGNSKCTIRYGRSEWWMFQNFEKNEELALKEGTKRGYM